MLYLCLTIKDFLLITTKMSDKMMKLNTLLLLCMTFTGLQAQQNTLTTGGNASGTDGSVSYSIGQALYTYTRTPQFSVVQGVQQPFEISVITSLEGYNNITMQCSAYPNPTTDYLKLNIGYSDTEKLVYQLYDINGKLLESKKVDAGETLIFLSNFIPATYFLKVTKEEKEIKTFKIIKN